MEFIFAIGMMIIVTRQPPFLGRGGGFGGQGGLGDDRSCRGDMLHWGWLGEAVNTEAGGRGQKVF